MATRPGSAKVSLPSDTEILIERSFEAPRALVWEALTEPQHLLRWWGPDWCPLVACEVDLRAGGAWRYVSRGVDGVELAWHGVYQRVEAPELIESTEVFEGFPDAESLNTMTLTELDGVTTLRTLVRHRTRENRDGHVNSGMEGGMQVTFDRLDALLVNADTTAERFRRVACAFTAVASAVQPHDWDRVAPCDGWKARDIVQHLVEWVPSVIGRSGIEFAVVHDAHDHPAESWRALAETLQRALDDPAVAAQRFDVGPPGEMTVEAAIGNIVLGDVFVHTWDLAVATNQAVTLDEKIASEMLEGMQPIDAMLRSSGHYGPRVPAEAGAGVVEQLIAFTGRDPNWR